jgi:Chain length determinant protein
MTENKITKTENIIDEIVKNKITVFSIIILFLVIAIVLTGFQKREYSSSAQVLIIQEQEHRMDAYLASKSSESLAKNLKKAMLTSSFRSKVLEDSSDFQLNFSKSEKNRRKEWFRMIDVKVIPNTSILEINTYHQSAFESEKILTKILSTLLTNHQLYHGGDTDVRLEIVNQPLTSIRPTRPNWPLNLFLSLILAVFFIVTLLALFPNKINLINRKLRKQNINQDKINEKKGNYKVFNYLDSSSKNNAELPADLFEEDEVEEGEEGFFKDESLNHSPKNKESNTTIEVENNTEIKKIIGNNHYLQRKD